MISFYPPETRQALFQDLSVGAEGHRLAAPGAIEARRRACRRSRCCSTRATSPS
ncbi:MAG: hypothetical protein MZW92_38925 [Comamonadaceae bacterium]|nr:hypothetical protein [Comamonadaceae bacterium]